MEGVADDDEVVLITDAVFHRSNSLAPRSVIGNKTEVTDQGDISRHIPISKFVAMFPVVVDSAGNLNERLVKKGAWSTLASVFKGDIDALRDACHVLSDEDKYEYLKPIVCAGGDETLDTNLVFKGEWRRLKKAFEQSRSITANDASATPEGFSTPTVSYKHRTRYFSAAEHFKQRKGEGPSTSRNPSVSPIPPITWSATSSTGGNFTPARGIPCCNQHIGCNNFVAPHDEFPHCKVCRRAWGIRKRKLDYFNEEK